MSGTGTLGANPTLGSLQNASVTPVVASPLDAFAFEGPLHFMARAIQHRLLRVFPAARFDHQLLDGRITKAQWARLTRRTPTVALGWAGVTPDRLAGNIFHGTAHWMVALVTRNEGGPTQRLLGDKLAPGVLALVRAAVLALEGYLIDPPDTPWAASGSIAVTNVSALYDDGWTDEALSVAGVELSVEYDEALPPALDTPNDLDAIAASWNFAPNGAWNDLWQRSAT